MSSTGTSGSGTSGTSGSSANDVISRLLRREGIVSKADLRVDVAKTVARVIVEDATIDLDEASLHARGNLRLSRASRTREVRGNYVVRIEEAYTNMIGAAVDEHVQGGVDYRMQRDHDIIMGGAYVNTIAGPFVRLCAFADFLCWGGWLELDVLRLEIAGIMIHAYMFYAHATGARITAACSMVDDFMIRTETFGVFLDGQSTAIHLGGPGASMEMAM